MRVRRVLDPRPIPHHVFLYKGAFVHVGEDGVIPQSVRWAGSGITLWGWRAPLLTYFPPHGATDVPPLRLRGWYGGWIASKRGGDANDLLQIRFKRRKDAYRWLRRAGEGTFQTIRMEAIAPNA